MATEAPTSEPQQAEPGLVEKIFDSPIVGMAPWIALSLLVGPGRFEVAVVVALVLSLVVLLSDVLRGRSVKLLAGADTAFFGAFAIVGLLASDAAIEWLETWAGELSNIALVIIAWGSIAIGVPFTIQYAREQAPREYWDLPIFRHINVVITAAWGVAFLVAAIAGFYGDAVLEDNDNLWTGWVVQIGALIVAIQFTQWYPDYASGRARQEAGVEGDPPPAVAELLIPLAGYLPVVGVLVLVFDAAPWWVGVGIIVAGGMLTNALRQQIAASKR